MGQTLAQRPDIVGDEAAEVLKSLQSKTKPFPDEIASPETKNGLENDVGMVFWDDYEMLKLDFCVDFCWAIFVWDRDIDANNLEFWCFEMNTITKTY